MRIDMKKIIGLFILGIWSLTNSSNAQIITGAVRITAASNITISTTSTKLRDSRLASLLSSLQSTVNDLEDVVDGGYAPVTGCADEGCYTIKTSSHNFDGLADVADMIREGDNSDARSELNSASECINSSVSGYGLYDDFTKTCDSLYTLIKKNTWTDEEGYNHSSAFLDYFDDNYSDLENAFSGIDDDLESYSDSVGYDDADDLGDSLEDYSYDLEDFIDELNQFISNMEVWQEL